MALLYQKHDQSWEIKYRFRYYTSASPDGVDDEKHWYVLNFKDSKAGGRDADEIERKSGRRPRDDVHEPLLPGERQDRNPRQRDEVRRGHVEAGVGPLPRRAIVLPGRPVMSRDLISPSDLLKRIRVAVYDAGAEMRKIADRALDLAELYSEDVW